MQKIRIIFLLFFVFLRDASALETYFSYEESTLKELAAQNSTSKMSVSELHDWDEKVKDLSVKNQMGPNYVRLFAYLYTAQRDAAFLSYEAHKDFVGSLGPVTAEVLQLFFPSQPSVEADPYSKQLANVVMAKIKKRFEDETAQMKEFPLSETDEKLKSLPQPYYGLKIASCQPWLLFDPKKFLAQEPPARNDPYWRNQAEEVKTAAKNATPEQLQATKYWAGDAWTRSGDALRIANEYMYRHPISFAKILCVRSVLAEAGMDVDIATFNSKYTYVITRPPILNPTIHPHVYMPHHPSYPSAHSTWFSAWATILSHYFPSMKNYWFQCAKEAGLSRIWAGIHYPRDHEGGWTLGTELGNAILQAPKVCQTP